MRFDFEVVAVRKRNHLPHWVTRHAMHAITFNLFDAMPTARLARIHEDLDATRRLLIARHGQLTAADRRALSQHLVNLQQSLLDEGLGSSFMSDPCVAELVATSLSHFDGVRYDLYAWCVMPNHVHVVAAPRAAETVDRLVHSWKGFSGRTANRLVRRAGQFWQADYFDRAVRNEQHLQRAVEYALDNPRRAGLSSWPYAKSYPERIASV